MLDLNNSRLRNDASRPMDIASTVVSLKEGALLVTELENGVAVVKPSAGASTEQVVGFAMNNPVNVVEATFVEEVVVPATSPYTVTLTRTPTATPSARFIANGSAMTHVAVADVDATGEFNVTGRVVTFDDSDAGKTVRVVGSYAPTVIEANALYGESMYTGGPSGVTGKTGVIFGADILWTDQYDPTSNWWAAVPAPIYSGANGKITLSSGGKALPGLIVVAAPQADRAMIGLQVRL